MWSSLGSHLWLLCWAMTHPRPGPLKGPSHFHTHGPGQGMALGLLENIPMGGGLGRHSFGSCIGPSPKGWRPQGSSQLLTAWFKSLTIPGPARVAGRAVQDFRAPVDRVSLSLALPRGPPGHSNLQPLMQDGWLCIHIPLPSFLPRCSTRTQLRWCTAPKTRKDTQ